MISVAAGALFHPNSVVLKTYSSDLLLEFMAGLWIGQLYLQKKLPNQKLGLLLAVAGFLIFGVEGSAFHPLDSYRIFIWGLPAVLIVTGGLSLEAAGKVKSIPLLRHIGDASFSIYLLHNIVVPAVGLLPLPVAAKAALALASTCVVGFLAYRYFEIPVNRFLRSTQAKYSFNPR
jgi:exopolysaccharide production protein ExoZ